ncbi:MAG: DUF1570 domain-containing protein [Planctomycetota bacterium]
MKFKLSKKDIRLLILLGVALMIFGYIKRPWFHTLKLESGHYICFSTATDAQTRQILSIAEALFESYTHFFDNQQVSHPKKLKLKLYKDRDEFKKYNMLSGWAEAFYRRPYCHQYYSDKEVNPYHWMVHEATHQLNAEVAGLKLEKWLNEGIAEYFGTSTLEGGRLIVGKIDINTYPIWWLDSLRLSGDIDKDIAATKIIPLKAVISNKGGPNLDEHFNLYYIHWWSLTHFLIHYEGGQYKDLFFDLVNDGGTLEAFEKHVGSVDEIQTQWYSYLQEKIADPS